MIIFEDVSHHFNFVSWKKLRQQVREIEQKFPKTVPNETGAYDVGMQIPGWGGWSLTSSNGHHGHGWFAGQKSFVKNDAGEVLLVGDEVDRSHTKYTEIATPHLKYCVERAKMLGLYPARARLTQMAPGDMTEWHIDALPETLATRLHFVIETNQNALMYTAEGEKHLEQDHVYIFNVNDYHQVKNFGDTIRTHLFMDVYDSLGITKHHSRKKRQ